MIVGIIVLAVLLILALFLVATYNGLVGKRARVDEAWSDITVQLKRRLDLIPNLVASVKGYAKHEAETLENVVKQRANSLRGDASPAEVAQADSAFTGALGKLIAVSENYPDLKASQNFQQLQSELRDTEDKIESSRRFYNGSARELNIAIQKFPNVLFAGALGFKLREFFDVDPSEADAVQQAPTVDFQ